MLFSMGKMMNIVIDNDPFLKILDFKYYSDDENKIESIEKDLKYNEFSKAIKIK